MSTAQTSPYRPLLPTRHHPDEPVSPSNTGVTSSINRARAATRQYLSSKISHYGILALVSLDVASIFCDFIVQILRCDGRITYDGAAIALDVTEAVGVVFSCLFMLELLASVWAFGLG